MRFAPAVALLFVAVATTACGTGDGSDDSSGDGRGSGGDGNGDRNDPSSLTVTVVDAPGTAPRTWALTCDPPGGDHPRPAQACAALDASPDPFSPVPPDRACTTIYGGPQTATVTGTWRGREIDASYRRTDGCEITRWEALTDVLGPGGV